MSFEWDRKKAALDLRRHGVDFADAVFVLEAPSALTMDDATDDEERFITMGMDSLGRILVVVYTWRGDQIRLISARSATRQERRQYEFEL